jgi:phage nucleotide-binding protein
MALKFTNTNKSSTSINLLCYGEAGTGKTTLISTAPKPIVISTESGLLSISDHDIPVIEIENLEDLMEAYDLLNTKKYLNKFKTVCLDSITDIAETVLSDLLKNTKDGRQAYGQLNAQLSELIRLFRDMPISSYFIAASETYENAAGMQAMRPSMPGRKLTNSLDYFFDLVLCLRINNDDVENPYRYLQTQPTNTIAAKDRSGKLKQFEKPNLNKLFKKLK